MEEEEAINFKIFDLNVEANQISLCTGGNVRTAFEKAILIAHDVSSFSHEQGEDWVFQFILKSGEKDVVEAAFEKEDYKPSKNKQFYFEKEKEEEEKKGKEEEDKKGKEDAEGNSGRANIRFNFQKDEDAEAFTELMERITPKKPTA